MTQEELLKRIKNVDYLTITKMSYEVIAQLTQDFKSLMVKELLKRGQTNEQQRAIIKAIKWSYKEWNKNENGVWSDFPGVFKYPKFLEELQVDIECGFMITDEKEADDFEKKIADYMERHTMTKEDIDDAIFEAENKAMTKEDIDEAISEAENNTDESSEKIAALEERIKELEEENERLKKQPTVDNTDEEFVEKKWISCFDTFLDYRLNAEAIAEKLNEIASPHLPKTKRSFWWVVFTVFSEIHWIPNTSTNQKTILQWANLHFNCGWDWRKNNQFKFSDIQAKIKTKKSSEWNKNLTDNVIGDYYGELAQNIKEAFVEIIDGRIIDRGCFILSGYQRINNGRK